MIELDVPVPAGAGAHLAHIEQAVETSCAAAGLRRTLKGTLASYPGCVHWHYAQPSARGTLEITWWPRRERLWLKVSQGRTAPWITSLLPHLQHTLQTALATCLAPAAQPPQ